MSFYDILLAKELGGTGGGGETVYPIIDVTELPSTDIQDKSFYRYQGLIYYRETSSNTWQVLVPQQLFQHNSIMLTYGLPEGDLTEYLGWIIFNRIDGGFYQVVDNGGTYVWKLIFLTNASPVTSSIVKPVNYTTVSANDCVFNFTFVDNTKNKTLENRIFFATVENPITHNAENGVLEVEQIKDSDGNFLFYQKFKTANVQINNIRKEYLRIGYVNNKTSITMDNIYENRADITWRDWFPIEYSTTNINISNPDFSAVGLTFCVTGGNVTFFIGGLKKEVDNPASDTIATIPSCLRCKNSSGAHTPVANSSNFNTFATLTEINSSNTLVFRGATTGASYYGTLVYALGY